jgi:hypothetical protein
MVQIVLIGIGAGLAAALLFASIVSGLLISLVLFYLAPLPIMIVALGWSHWSGLIAALVAAAGLAASLKDNLFLAFLLGIGLPAWWLSYLTLLARPVATAGGVRLEWYPVGRLVIWGAILSFLVVTAALLAIGQTEETIRAELRSVFETVLRRPNSSLAAPPLADYDGRIDAFVTVAPLVAAVSITGINLAMLWLSARIVKLSNRLRRPWPDIAAMNFPPAALAMFGAAIAGVLLAGVLGLLGMLAGVFAASLGASFTILGFAVLHTITRGMGVRAILLSTVYVAAVLIWPVSLLMTLLGLAETTFDIRGRIANRRGPPTLPT